VLPQPKMHQCPFTSLFVSGSSETTFADCSAWHMAQQPGGWPISVEPTTEAIGVIASAKVVVAGFGVPLLGFKLVCRGATICINRSFPNGVSGKFLMVVNLIEFISTPRFSALTRKVEGRIEYVSLRVSLITGWERESDFGRSGAYDRNLALRLHKHGLAVSQHELDCISGRQVV